MDESTKTQLVPRALGVLASWERGALTTKQAERDLVALGYSPDEAFDVLARRLLGTRESSAGPASPTARVG